MQIITVKFVIRNIQMNFWTTLFLGKFIKTVVLIIAVVHMEMIHITIKKGIFYGLKTHIYVSINKQNFQNNFTVDFMISWLKQKKTYEWHTNGHKWCITLSACIRTTHSFSQVCSVGSDPRTATKLVTKTLTSGLANKAKKPNVNFRP